jgi:hypothetical protein
MFQKNIHLPSSGLQTDCFSLDARLTYSDMKDGGSIQNSWATGLCPPSRIQNTRKHNILETGSVSILRWGEGETPTELGPLEKN